MNYNTVDFDVLNQTFLPTFLRGNDIRAFVNSVTTPVRQLYEDTLYKMEHNGQVIYLEKMLNQFYNITGYDPTNHLATRMIYITDAPQVPRVYIYRPEENQPVYLGTAYLNRPQVQYNFIINIPNWLVFDEATLRAKVDYFRNTKQYIIHVYE